MFDLDNFAETKAALEAYDFKVVTWDGFVLADDLPQGLFARAERIRTTMLSKGADAGWVVYDPLDNDDGWLLVGGQIEVARETCSHLIDGAPDEGPLAKEHWPDWWKKVDAA